MAKKPTIPEPEPGSATEIVEAIGNQAVNPLGNGRLIPRPGQRLSECPTSLDLSTPRGKALAFQASNPGDVEFGDGGRAVIVATDWIIFPDEGIDPETGEIGVFARTVLFTRDGKHFRTSSAHMPHRMAALMDLFSKDDWRDGIPIIISERRSRKTGHTYHDIRIDADALQGGG